MTTLGMPHEGQVRVENEGERAGHGMEWWSNGVMGWAFHCRTTPSLHYSSIPALRPLERSAKILEAIESFLDYVDAGGVAEPNSAIVAEGRTGYDCDIRFTQKAIGKIL